jgi:FixJ family two-component response regulator
MLFTSAEALHGNFDQAFRIVLDINLGDRSGIELRRSLAHSGVMLPVIFITGNDDHVTRKTAIPSGCIAYLTKPFSAKSLIDAIQRASVGPAQRAAWRDHSSLRVETTAGHGRDIDLDQAVDGGDYLC